MDHDNPGSTVGSIPKTISAISLSTLDRHILLRHLTATGAVLVALVIIGWFTQVVSLLDFVVIYGQSVLEFVGVTMLLVPLIVALIMPTAVFVATAFVLDRMNADSELAVISSAGVSRWRLMRPFAVSTLIAVAVSLAFSLVLQPMALGELRQKRAELRADLISTLISEGQFSSPRSGLMMHVREKTVSGDLRGIIFEDSRNPDETAIYLAREARLLEHEDQSFLLLTDGTVLRPHADRPTVDLVHFEQYTLNLSAFFGELGPARVRPSEMTVGELFEPEATVVYATTNPVRLRAEAHSRLSTPLHTLVTMLIAFAGLCEPRSTRRGRVWSIMATTGIASVVRVGGVMLVSASEKSSDMVTLVYALPIAVMAICLIYMARRDSFGYGRSRSAGPAEPGWAARS